MSHCVTCGRPTDRFESCETCEPETEASLAEHLLAEPPAPGDDAPRERPTPEPPAQPLVEALAGELLCRSCRTSVPPASLFCGVCGLRLGSSAAHGA